VRQPRQVEIIDKRINKLSKSESVPVDLISNPYEQTQSVRQVAPRVASQTSVRSLPRTIERQAVSRSDYSTTQQIKPALKSPTRSVPKKSPEKSYSKPSALARNGQVII
jgi:hypothetical protein